MRRWSSSSLVAIALFVSRCGGEALEERAIVVGLEVARPAPMSGVHVEVVFEDGDTLAGQVRSGEDGAIEQIPDLPEPGDLALEDEDGIAESSFGLSPAPCSDRARQLLGFKWNQTLRWSFNASTTPSGLSRDSVELVLRRSTNNITRSRNDCSISDEVSAANSYAGRTDRRANVGSDGACGSPDGTNVVSFGSLPTGVLAVTCTWFNTSGAVESDVRLTTSSRWYTSRPSGCTSRFSLESVMTHERGHSFGLGHVSERDHGRLTMSTKIGPCDDSARTLGRGDVIGLRSIY
jgi:hypothetical protein